MKMTHQYFLLRTAAGEEFRVVASLDLDAIVTRLAGKARSSNGGKASAMHGAIVVKEMRDLPPQPITKGESTQ